jgi:pSer/pThr/pTyr-binding forkhead associated (FHA) protein
MHDYQPVQSQRVTPLRLTLIPGGSAITLTYADMLIGRHSEADIRLHLPDVSRRHCRFRFHDGSWHVYDLSSMNGVYVNDERVGQAELHDSDLIRIGGYTFEAHYGEPGTACSQTFPAIKSVASQSPETNSHPRKAS